MASELKACKKCKYGEPVLANTRVWCRHPILIFGNIPNMSFSKDWFCASFEGRQHD